jgi:hypothetical protein
MSSTWPPPQLIGDRREHTPRRPDRAGRWVPFPSWRGRIPGSASTARRRRRRRSSSRYCS